MPPSALSTKLHRFISPDAKLRRNSPGYGAVSYGNIGSGTRLGFTLIRRDVNLVSRIQTACAVPWQTLLLSSFAGLLDGSEARPVGRYDPKAFDKPVELFTLRPARPCPHYRGKVTLVRIFAAGATGALGRQLLPKLTAAGHSVWGMKRSPAKPGLVRAAGATPVIADALDQNAILAPVADAAPDVIGPRAGGASSFASLRRFDRKLARTNRLRTEGRATC
jgi:hypothetical protein